MKNETFHSMIENLFNGNLTDAKATAKRTTFLDIQYFCLGLGYPEDASFKIAAYLKGKISFNEYCAKD
jgi:hypothetical protein